MLEILLWSITVNSRMDIGGDVLCVAGKIVVSVAPAANICAVLSATITTAATSIWSVLFLQQRMYRGTTVRVSPLATPLGGQLNASRLHCCCALRVLLFETSTRRGLTGRSFSLKSTNKKLLHPYSYCTCVLPRWMNSTTHCESLW